MASTQIVDINMAVTNTVLSWHSHFQVEQAWAPHPPNLQSLRENTFHTTEQGTFSFLFSLFLKLPYLLTFYSVQAWLERKINLLRWRMLLVRKKLLLRHLVLLLIELAGRMRSSYFLLPLPHLQLRNQPPLNPSLL